MFMIASNILCCSWINIKLIPDEAQRQARLPRGTAQMRIWKRVRNGDTCRETCCLVMDPAHIYEHCVVRHMDVDALFHSYRRWSLSFRLRESCVLGFEPEDPQEWSVESQKQLLGRIHCSGEAFWVFQIEEVVTGNSTSDLGVFETGELKSHGTVTLTKVVCEPDTIGWEHYGDSTPMKRFGRLLMGLGRILTRICD